MTSAVEPVTDQPALLAESPVWDERSDALLWVDILRGEVHRLHEPHRDEVMADLDMPVGAVAPRTGGGYVIAAAMGSWLLDGGPPVRIAAATDAGERMNDGKCDPAGRWWAGTMTADRGPGAALYCLDTDRRVRRVLDDVRLSNGLGWSPDGRTMYYIDTPTRRVDAFDFDLSTGAIDRRRVFVDTSDAPGNPDGLTVDADGGVWVAMAKGSAVRRYTEQGRLDRTVELPVQKVTSCAFGGPDLGDLYITTASDGLSDAELMDQPQAGLVFRHRPGVCGLPAGTYAG